MPCERHSDYILVTGCHHIDIKAGKSPEDIVVKEAFHSSPFSRAMKREIFLLLSKYAWDQPALRLRQTHLKIHDISFVYEDVTRFRQRLLGLDSGYDIEGTQLFYLFILFY